MKNQNIWIKRSAIYFYFFSSSIGFASDNTNDRAVKRHREYSETEQPVRKNMRKLTEDEQEKAEIKLCKVQSCIRNLKIPFEKEEAVFILNISDFYIDDFFRNNFLGVLEKLRKMEKIPLFQYLLQDLNPTMDDIRRKQFRYNIKENENWIESSLEESNIYFFKEILDKKEMVKSLYFLADVERQKTLSAYFIFAYNQESDLNDIKDRMNRIGINYKKNLENVLKQAEVSYKDCRTYMIKEEKITNGRNVTNISKKTVDKIQAYMDNMEKIKDEANQAYTAYIDEIVKIYSAEMMYLGYMMDMKLLPNQVNRFYETDIKKFANTLSSVSLSNITDVKKKVNILWRRNQIYLNIMRSLANTIYDRNEKDIDKIPNIAIFSVALIENSWKYQKIALIPNDIYDFDLVYAIAKKSFEELSLEFDSTAKKSRNFYQAGVKKRDDYLLDLMNVLNCDLYSCSRTPDVARIEISPDHSFPYALAERLEKICIEEDYEDEEF